MHQKLDAFRADERGFQRKRGGDLPLDTEVERWEGIFEAGGKKEYVKYDKTDAAYPQKVITSADGLNKIQEAVKKKLDEKGLKSQEVLSSSEEKRIELYKELAKEANLKAYEKQNDVYGFLEKVVQKLAVQ